jgi:hypothetical protein
MIAADAFDTVHSLVCVVEQLSLVAAVAGVGADADADADGDLDFLDEEGLGEGAEDGTGYLFAVQGLGVDFKNDGDEFVSADAGEEGSIVETRADAEGDFG